MGLVVKMSVEELRVKEYREKIDEMKRFILKYGVFPTLMYVVEKGEEEKSIWIFAFVELKSEGKLA